MHFFFITSLRDEIYFAHYIKIENRVMIIFFFLELKGEKSRLSTNLYLKERHFESNFRTEKCLNGIIMILKPS